MEKSPGSDYAVVIEGLQADRSQDITMAQIFGDFISEFPPDHDSLVLTFSPNSRPIQHRWRNNRLSAYFVADYFSTFLAIEDESDNEKRIQETKSAVSYISNELLENAMKFNNHKDYRVTFDIHFLEESDLIVVLSVTNSLTSQAMEAFKTFIDEFSNSDPDDFYIQQIERAEEDEDSDASGLGFFTMINDYSAKLGWKFEILLENPKIITVTTMAQVTV